MLPPNWCQNEALHELGRLLQDTDPKAKARAFAHVKARTELLEARTKSKKESKAA